MKKINKIKNITGVLTLLLILSSCSNWFDETPDSQIRDEEQFSTEIGFQQQLTGCYLGMSDNDLFGKNLSWLYPDILSQSYENRSFTLSSDAGSYMQAYNYKSSVSMEVIDKMWKSMYNVISNVNQIIENIDERKDVFTSVNYYMIKGEALAIRGYMHFELMRLYGHSNLADITDKASLLAIPYYLNSSKDFVKQLSYNETFTLMIKDMEEAIELLKKDPIILANNDLYNSEANVDGYYDYRNLKINYYAAQAILAQIYMWEGSNENMRKAQVILNNIIAENNGENNVFTWDIEGLDDNPAQTDEILFAVNNMSLSSSVTQYFSYNFAPTLYSAIYLTETRAKDIFETNVDGAGDIRFSKLLQLYTNLEFDGPMYIPKKYRQENISIYENEDIIPIIRLSEIYLMNAECSAVLDNDLVEAKIFVQVVRSNRGLVTELVGDTVDEFLVQLGKEYAREYLAEGGLWFWYKRNGIGVLENTAGDIIEMNDEKYMFPFPDFEIQNGREQKIN